MTGTDAPALLRRLTVLWPGAKPLSGDEREIVQGYVERLGPFDIDLVIRAVTQLSDEGSRSRPNPGEIRKRCQAMGGGKADNDVGCTCYLDGLAGCRAKHSPEWREHQRDRDQAVEIAGRAERNGEMIDPDAFPAYLGFSERAVQLGRFYDANAKAGRAIHDPGDEHGCPTVGKGARCRLAPPPPPRPADDPEPSPYAWDVTAVAKA